MADASSVVAATCARVGGGGQRNGAEDDEQQQQPEQVAMWYDVVPFVAARPDDGRCEQIEMNRADGGLAGSGGGG